MPPTLHKSSHTAFLLSSAGPQFSCLTAFVLAISWTCLPFFFSSHPIFSSFHLECPSLWRLSPLSCPKLSSFTALLYFLHSTGYDPWLICVLFLFLSEARTCEFFTVVFPLPRTIYGTYGKHFIKIGWVKIKNVEMSQKSILHNYNNEIGKAGLYKEKVLFGLQF